ncbi:hypothetical protein WAE58_04535 [Pedobacter panaciterrae]|uniref:Uncharacterized protein n=1 Tax=Pedobacter panaciterrae TaxID=363849 RepID=A0ABU8NIH1_9SPHI
MKRLFAKLFLFIPFLTLMVASFIWADLPFLDRYTTSFITISLTIATFSITFSFLQYQFSPYKALLRSISVNHQSWCYALILIALIPIATLFIDKRYLVQASMFCIPILAYGVVMLPLISSEETNPKLLLERAMKLSRIQRFLKTYQTQEKREQDKQETLSFSITGEMPMHDYSTKYHSAPIWNDPFSLINSIIELALKNSDSVTYEQTIDQYFRLTNLCLENQRVDYKSGFRFSVNKLISDNFEIIASTVVSNTKSLPLQSLLIYKTGDFLKGKALSNQQTSAPFDDIAASLVGYVKIQLSQNRDAAIYITSLFRQLAQKGIYNPPEEGAQPSMFNAHLIAYPNYIKTLGQHAIKEKNSDYLFRCLEELGYLGCTAVKNNHYQVIIECLQGIVQLGREARAGHLKCFWRHCALEAVDHAEERLHWMLSWLPRLPEQDRDLLARSFSTAFSRIHGSTHEISFQPTDDTPAIVFNNTKEPHIESYSQERYYRKVDYSDVSEIKEFKLY